MNITINNNGCGFIVTRPSSNPNRREALLTDGTWSTAAASYQPTEELAQAFAEGLGALPLSFGHERELIETAEALEERASDCLQLKTYPTIDRLIGEGKRDEALTFARSIPESYFRDVACDRALNHDP